MQLAAPFPASVLAIALLAAASTAQSAPCLAMNDTNTTVSTSIYSYGFAGQNTNAWQITPTTPLAVQSLRLYTGNNFPSAGGFMTASIWSENPATSLPGTRLASGTWQIVQAIGWRGADLDAVVVMQPNTHYWVAFTEPGWSTVPIEPGGVSVPTARMSGTSWSAGAGPEAVKLRLYCGLLDEAYLTPSGSGCAAAAGGIGSLFSNQSPQIGNSGFYLEGSGYPGNALAFLAMGLNLNWVAFPLPGGNPSCLLGTDPQFAITALTGTGTTRATPAVGALGHVTVAMPVPSNPSLAGLGVLAQLLVVDAGSTWPVPLMTSNALQLTLY